MPVCKHNLYNCVPLLDIILNIPFQRDVQEDYDEIVGGWKAKLKRSSVGEQRWGLFMARKNDQIHQ